VDVYDPSVPNECPRLRLDLPPEANGVITKLTELRGLVDDPDDNLSRYVVEVAPDGTNNWMTMFMGTTEVADGGVLGKFDPTILEDGRYRLRLTPY
jgi:hypothetical protein